MQPDPLLLIPVLYHLEGQRAHSQDHFTADGAQTWHSSAPAGGITTDAHLHFAEATKSTAPTSVSGTVPNLSRSLAVTLLNRAATVQAGTDHAKSALNGEYKRMPATESDSEVAVDLIIDRCGCKKAVQFSTSAAANSSLFRKILVINSRLFIRGTA